MAIANSWNEFWNLVDNDKIARFHEPLSYVSIYRDRGRDNYRLTYAITLPDNELLDSIADYSRAAIQEWLSAGFKPGVWRLSDE